MTFDDLRTEYERLGIGERIYGIILGLAGAICRKYPEAVYNEGLAWDEHSVSDLAQDVAVNRLINEGQLDYIFSESRTIESVRRLITRQIKRELHHRRRITPIDRLLVRIEGLVEAGHVELVPGATPTYRSVGSGAIWSPITPLEESLAVAAATGIPILYSNPDATRESQIFTASALRQVLEAFFTVAPSLTEQELRRILEKLLTPWTPANLVRIEDHDEIQDQPMSAVLVLEISETARTWVDGLSDDECWVYYYRSMDLPDARTAARIGKSRSTVINLKKRVLERATAELLADLDPRHHLDAVRFAQEHCAHRLGEPL